MEFWALMKSWNCIVSQLWANWNIKEKCYVWPSEGSSIMIALRPGGYAEALRVRVEEETVAELQKNCSALIPFKRQP